MSECPHCATFAEENNNQHLEIVGYQAEILHLVREKNALKRELTAARRSDPNAQDIERILKLWRAACVPRSSRNRVSIDLDGDRAKVVRAALKSKVTGTRKERRRMCADAIRGLALRPYVVNAQRKGAGTKEQRYCDVEHALKDEKHIEEHAGFYRMAQAKPELWHEQAYCAAVDVSSRWFNVWMSAKYERALEESRERLRNDPEAVKAHAAKSGFTVEQVEASIHGRPIPPADWSPSLRSRCRSPAASCRTRAGCWSPASC
jgi:hypothetical protein